MQTIIIKILLKLSTILRKIANRLSETNEWRTKLMRWKEDEGEKFLRFNYPQLNPSSIVFDLGGYEGQWASDIYSMKKCNVYVFEPYIPFFNKIKHRFQQNQDIKVFPFGLGAEDKQDLISIDADATSTFKKGDEQSQIEIRDIEDFLRKEKLEKIDLMKINIEGGEYDLLSKLLASDLAKNVSNLQIQFHDFVPNATDRMEEIQRQLAKTHELTYQYSFLWENWSLKKL